MHMDIEVYFEEGAKVNARLGKHVVKTDQKERGGGEDSAPAPFDYFLVSIATCAGIYVKVFCDKRGIDSSKIRINQKHRNDPQTRKLIGIDLDIILPEDFPDKYREAVLKAADQCAVKRLLKDPPEIEVQTVSA
ncbi:MAG: osmotically inducible protein OsmC [Bacteroidetes bacterium]|nr:MAG: osmotically inducible protein OsmC [Bacteroidota bacterium]